MRAQKLRQMIETLEARQIGRHEPSTSRHESCSVKTHAQAALMRVGSRSEQMHAHLDRILLHGEQARGRA